MTSSSGIAKKARPPDPRRPAHFSPSVHIHIAASLQQSKDYTYVEKVQDVLAKEEGSCTPVHRSSHSQVAGQPRFSQQVHVHACQWIWPPFSFPRESVHARLCIALAHDLCRHRLAVAGRQFPRESAAIPAGLPTGERLPGTDRISSNKGRTGGWETMPFNPRHHQAGFGLGGGARRRSGGGGGSGGEAWCGYW